MSDWFAKPRGQSGTFESMKLFLANYALGRMLLHLGCICRGGKKPYHREGIRREFRNVTSICRMCQKPR
jgi:hypothetical protein